MRQRHSATSIRRSTKLRSQGSFTGPRLIAKKAGTLWPSIASSNPGFQSSTGRNPAHAGGLFFHLRGPCRETAGVGQTPLRQPEAQPGGETAEAIFDAAAKVDRGGFRK